jgi:hypothetical protein
VAPITSANRRELLASQLRSWASAVCCIIVFFLPIPLQPISGSEAVPLDFRLVGSGSLRRLCPIATDVPGHGDGCP